MQRPGSVLAIAIVELVGSALVLAMAAMMAVGAMVEMGAAAAAPVPLPTHLAMLAAVAVYVAFAAWGIATAVGMLHMRRWALVSTLLYAFLLLAGGAGVVVVMAVLPIPNAPPAAAAFVRIFAGGMGLAAVGLAIWWIACLLRARTRSAFGASLVGGNGRGQPLSIAILGWLSIVGGAICLIALPLLGSRTHVVLLGHAVTGFAAELAYGVIGVIAVAIGLGLLWLRPWARIAAMVWYVLGAVNTAALWLVPGAWQRSLPAIPSGPGRDAALTALSLGGFLAVIFLLSLAVTFVALYFLWSRRPAFQRAL